MKLYKFKSIRTRFAYWILLFALVPLLIALTITYFQRVNGIEEKALDKLSAIRDLKVQQVENWLNNRLGDVQVMAGDFEIKALENTFDKKVKSAEDIEKIEIAKELINRNLRNYPDYEEIFVIDSNSGIIELSTNEQQIGKNKSIDTYFTVPIETGQIFIKDIYYSDITHQPEMTISLPIYCLEHNTHVIGILVARINLDNSLYKLLLNRTGLGETGETVIVNSDAIALNEFRWHENAPLKLKLNAVCAIKAANGETGTCSSKDYRNEDVLATYTFITKTGWGFVCKQDKNELNAPIRKMTLSFILIFGLIAIIVLFISLFIIKSISKPIIELSQVSQKVEKGDYSIRNNINSDDEIGLLAKAQNNMADAIESRIKIQQGVTDISETMIGQSSMHDFGTELLKQLMEITVANMGVFYILNEVSSEFEHFSSIGANKKLLKPFSLENPEGEMGNAISKKKICYQRNIPENTIFKYQTSIGEIIPKEIITIPILVENSVVALISLVSIQKFNKEGFDILNNSWTNINTSYSNLIAGERTAILAEYLSETNQKLEAQTEELQEQAEELQQTTEELQQQNLELEAQRKNVEAANKLKSEFLANMSHELRTPLNSIMALSRVLLVDAKDKLDDDENNYLEIVERNGKRLLSLINDILDLSKIEAGKMEILPNFISLGTLLQIIKENVQSLSEEKGLTLTLNITDNLPKIETDESKLYQVLTNIIGNSVKFTEKGTVDISVKHDSQNVFIEVKDTGIGISKEVIPHIFEEFIQADGTASRLYEGTGLGLTIANKITKILGGDIMVKSKLGMGSVFVVTLPIKWHQDFVLARASKKNKKTATATEITIPEVETVNTVENKISKNRLLIVEDNPDAIIQLIAVLKNENYKVDVARSGQEALDYIQKTIPDGIILDLMMPEIDGFEVLERLRSANKTKNIPVLILTAKDLTVNDLSRLKASNVQQLIYKGDIDIKGLINKVKLMLNVEGIKTLTPKPNILVVEDNLDNMITIKAIIKGSFTISEAVDGEEGFRLAKSFPPDLILLDMSLPKKSGEEIIKKIKNNNITKKIPVIAVTAQAMKGDKKRFLKAGCDGYISKPIDAEMLLLEINKLLNK